MPWPAMTWRVVEGRDLGEALVGGEAAGCRRRPRPGERPVMRTSAPRARMAATLASGTRADMQTTARRRRARAAKATARPWLPVEQQVTPGVPGGRRATALRAPRSLKAPIGWASSSFSRRSGSSGGGDEGRADGAAGDGAAGGEDVGEGEREGHGGAARAGGRRRGRPPLRPRVRAGARIVSLFVFRLLPENDCSPGFKAV